MYLILLVSLCPLPNKHIACWREKALIPTTSRDSTKVHKEDYNYENVIDNRYVRMSSATVSSKFQILIPKDVRESMNLKPGQKLDFIQIGGSLRVVPQRSMKDIAGIASHVTEPFERDRSDLDDDPELRAAVDARLNWAANTVDAAHKRFTP